MSKRRARGPSRTASSSSIRRRSGLSANSGPGKELRGSQEVPPTTAAGRLDDWLRALVATPGLTAIKDFEEARRALLDDSLRGVELVRRFDGPIVDVGSGGGVPGIPLAVTLPEREVTLLDANARKCDFLRRWAPPNASVVQGRAEEQQIDQFGVAVAKALAPPPVAAEWCLPLVRPGGAAVLWVGPSADSDRIGRVAAHVGGELAEAGGGFLILRKVKPTPEGFPRRTGVARKRPLA